MKFKLDGVYRMTVGNNDTTIVHCSKVGRKNWGLTTLEVISGIDEVGRILLVPKRQKQYFHTESLGTKFDYPEYWL